MNMNLDSYELKVSDSTTNREITLVYRGNENVVIYYNLPDNLVPLDCTIHVPRTVLENFIRLINEG